MSAKSKVIAKLQSYLKSDAWQKLKNKNKKYTQFLESLTEEDIDVYDYDDMEVVIDE